MPSHTESIATPHAPSSVGEKDAFASALSTSAGNGASATSRANHAVVSSVNTPPRRKPYPSSTRSRKHHQVVPNRALHADPKEYLRMPASAL